LSSPFQPLAGLRGLKLRDGVTARANEQLGFILQGSMTFTVGGEKRELRAGDTYEIPSHVPHDAVAGPQGCTAVDAFAPIRADWEKLDRLDPFPPDWPPS